MWMKPSKLRIFRLNNGGGNNNNLNGVQWYFLNLDMLRLTFIIDFFHCDPKVQLTSSFTNIVSSTPNFLTNHQNVEMLQDRIRIRGIII